MLRESQMRKTMRMNTGKLSRENEPVEVTKSFNILRKIVWNACKQVKANQGSAGVDSQSLEDFEGDLSRNLQKLWNRMCSGSYFPPPVKRVGIPKKQGELATMVCQQ
jgi:RNA-directed DNA polymerase